MPLNVLHLGYKFALYHLTLIVLNMTKVKQFEELCKRLHDLVFYFKESVDSFLFFFL